MTAAPLRYVVLWHRRLVLRQPVDSGRPDGRADHYDWMFETTEGLLTWATERLPAIERETWSDALALPLHRLEYLDYEGPISGDRGTVVRVESGTYRLRTQRPERLEFDFSGQRSGRGVFYRTSAGDPSSWRFGFRPANTRLSRVETS